VVGYDGGWNVRDEESSVGQKKLVRKAETPSKRGIRWPRWTGFRGKTVWDWQYLLLGALATTIIATLQIQLSALQQQQVQAIEEQRAQDAAVHTYTTQMIDLFTTSNYLDEVQEDETRTLARAHTLAALEEADLPHKKRIMQFLYDARLIQGNTPPVSLSGADLTGINFSDVDLSKANLSGADMHNSALDATNLSGAYLRGAKGISNKELEHQAYSLEGAIMPNGQKYEDWLKDRDKHQQDE